VLNVPDPVARTKELPASHGVSAASTHFRLIYEYMRRKQMMRDRERQKERERERASNLK
jgi:hypothetical protein